MRDVPFCVSCRRIGEKVSPNDEVKLRFKCCGACREKDEQNGRLYEAFYNELDHYVGCSGCK